MSKKYLAIAMLCAGVFSTFPKTAEAGLWDKRTVVTFSQAVEVPGAVLQPGKYVMSLVGSPSDRNVVQFSNERENRVYATALTINAERFEPPDKTMLTFYEVPKGQPEVLKTWFFPGETIGREFIYPKDRLSLIAANTQTIEIAPAAPTQAQAAPPSSGNDSEINEAILEAVKPVPAPAAPEVAAAEVTPQEEPVVIAQNTPPPAPVINNNDNQPTEPATSELPKTAGEMPLIGLIGVLSLGAAAGLRRRKLAR